MPSVLISGAGIAGMSLAYWLVRAGHRPTLVERASTVRTGGYMIDLCGAGFDIADKMDLVADLRALGCEINEIRLVNGDGRKISGLDAVVFRQKLQERFLSIRRGDLAALLFEKIRNDVDVIFDDAVSAVRFGARAREVSFERGGPREFDAVVGADGLHSNVRSLVFGNEKRFEHHLGSGVAHSRLRDTRSAMRGSM